MPLTVLRVSRAATLCGHPEAGQVCRSAEKAD